MENENVVSNKVRQYQGQQICRSVAKPVVFFPEACAEFGWVSMTAILGNLYTLPVQLFSKATPWAQGEAAANEQGIM